MSPAEERLIIDAIEDAIMEGARDWDAFAVPTLTAPAEKAWRRIKEIMASKPVRVAWAEPAPVTQGTRRHGKR